MASPKSTLSLNVNNKKIYKIDVFNIKNNERRYIHIGIIDFSGEDIHYASFCCLNEDFIYQNITNNLFSEYQKFREPAESKGWRFKTKGALRNARPSGMLLNWGLGKAAYLLKEEKDISGANKEPEMCNIFDYEENISEQDTIIEQEIFWENYKRNSIKN